MRITRYLVVAAAILVCSVLLSCAAAREAVTERIIRLPSVRIVFAEITELSFTGARLLFDVKIRNTNPIGFTLEGFEYDFLIEDETFLRGRQDGRVGIEANGSSIRFYPHCVRHYSFGTPYRRFSRMSRIAPAGINASNEAISLFSFDISGTIE